MLTVPASLPPSLQGVMKALNVNKLTRSGCVFKFWVADWFAQLNNKMGGDLKKIQAVGRYMIEGWRAVGMDLTRVQFLWSSEEINGRAGEYWPLVMDIARKNKLPRIISQASQGCHGSVIPCHVWVSALRIACFIAKLRGDQLTSRVVPATADGHCKDPYLPRTVKLQRIVE